MTDSEIVDPERRSADVVSVAFRRQPVTPATAHPEPPTQKQVSFDRRELQTILNLYGRRVAEGEWRDYAIGFSPQKAVFAIFRRASETPLYTIEKNPALARRQGAYSVVSADGFVLKRGHDLERVLAVLDKKLKLVVT
ncbi:MAG: DUF2794 domain-containing protein [Rhodoblastus sp.]|nr:DUF2794 domain-containing protein [Rhodoblastus sp.]MCB1525939.1 DUF2794 domain-containing protein [Rhodoblastus sp.]MCB9997729.1 DUF2794 domain-containing protein [Methylobacteriaceae bacterium]MCO5086492.1 DUF2794 domain-containing protein [Methylobacteriaceae bacterium]